MGKGTWLELKIEYGNNEMNFVKEVHLNDSKQKCTCYT